MTVHGLSGRPRTAPTPPGQWPEVSSFDRIVIIFNPQSTGDAPRVGRELRDELATRLRSVPLDLSPPGTPGTPGTWPATAAGTGAL